MSLPVFSHSQIALYRQCQKRYDYRYRQKLVPKRVERPLFIGNWVHRCLETHYGQGDWKIGHREYLKQYGKLLDEEKKRLDRGTSKAKDDDKIEPLPVQIKRIMDSYVWYNREEKIKTLFVEVPINLTVQDEHGDVYVLTMVLDQVYEDEDGLVWVRDNKIWGELPDVNAFHTMDPQLTIYLEGLKKEKGIEAVGVEYNYVQSRAPSFPSINKSGPRKGQISESAIVTDYPTVYRWLKANDYDPSQFRSTLEPLAGASPLLRRYRQPRIQLVTDRIFAELDQTAREIMGNTPAVRNITRDCNWCPYQAVCRAELYDLDTSHMRRTQFMTEKEREAARRKRQPTA